VTASHVLRFGEEDFFDFDVFFYRVAIFQPMYFFIKQIYTDGWMGRSMDGWVDGWVDE